jgi:hypothetical protein
MKIFKVSVVKFENCNFEETTESKFMSLIEIEDSATKIMYKNVEAIFLIWIKKQLKESFA